MADNLPDVYLKFTDSDPDIRGESMDAAYPADDGWLCIRQLLSLTVQAGRRNCAIAPPRLCPLHMSLEIPQVRA